MSQHVPLVVRAKLKGAVRSPDTMLDSLLGAAIARKLALPPVDAQDHAGAAANHAIIDAAIPLARAREIFLCTTSQYRFDEGSYEVKYLNRRFPASDAVSYATPKFKTVEMSTGLNKNYRIPVQQAHVVSDVVLWYAVGDQQEVLQLLSTWILHIGKKGSIGCGAVDAWDVLLCEETWDGFPVLREGQPLRPLPLDWPGLSKDARQDYRVLTMPYWQRHREVLAAVPG